MKYVIITPVKDEEEFVEEMINSVVSQSVKPLKFILVDDGSSDSSVKIIKKFVENYDWINLVERKSINEKRKYGSKVIKAFYAGYNTLNDHNYDFIVKLDADLRLPENYFETVIDTFKSDPRVGLTAGFIMNKLGDKLVQDGPIDYHIRGALKSIRKECWDDINGFREMFGWDGLDEMDAMYKGWKTKVFEVPVIHFRPMAASYNPYQLALDRGRYHYKLRSSFFLTLIRALINMVRKPYLINGLLYIVGYCQGILLKDDLIIEKGLSKFINRFHLRRIFKDY